MLNEIPTSSIARQPRARIEFSDTYGQSTRPFGDCWVSWAVTSNSYYEADTFRVALSAGKLPPANDASWFAGITELYIKILAGFPADPDATNAADLAPLIYGRVDDVDYDPVRTEIVLTGRDLTAAFIDNKLTQEYQNQTASQVVAQIAAARGVNATITDTDIKVGTYFKNDQVRMQANRSEWDLICWLAREEGFVAFVSLDQGLYFGPDPRDTSNPYVIRWQKPGGTNASPTANVIELDFSRSLTVAKGISVTVRSTQRSRKTAVVESYPSNPKGIQAGKASPFGDVQNYYFNARPDLAAAAVVQLAQATYNRLISHTMKLRARMPGDNLMAVTVPVQVDGTGTAYDQLYFPRRITRQMSIDEGYVMGVEAQNTTPELAEATIPL